MQMILRDWRWGRAAKCKLRNGYPVCLTPTPRPFSEKMLWVCELSVYTHTLLLKWGSQYGVERLKKKNRSVLQSCDLLKVYIF